MQEVDTSNWTMTKDRLGTRGRFAGIRIRDWRDDQAKYQQTVDIDGKVINVKDFLKGSTPTKATANKAEGLPDDDSDAPAKKAAKKATKAAKPAAALSPAWSESELLGGVTAVDRRHLARLREGETRICSDGNVWARSGSLISVATPGVGGAPSKHLGNVALGSLAESTTDASGTVEISAGGKVAARKATAPAPKKAAKAAAPAKKAGKKAAKKAAKGGK